MEQQNIYMRLVTDGYLDISKVSSHAGITSFGDGCGKRLKFGIYTKITNYVDFIWSIVNCNGLCENNNTY
jgi:secreted trypsin-like serine protease